MRFVKMFLSALLSPFKFKNALGPNDSIETQIRLSIAIPLQELSPIQIQTLEQGETLLVSITNPVIKTIMGNGTVEHFIFIMKIVQELGATLRYQIHIFPDLTGLQTEYFMAVNMYPDDLALLIKDDDDDDGVVNVEQPVEVVVIPMKAMAAGAGGRR